MRMWSLRPQLCKPLSLGLAVTVLCAVVALLLAGPKGAIAQDNKPPVPVASPSMEERLTRLEGRVESLQPEKDFFDKIEAISGLATGIGVLVIAQYFNSKQRRTEDRHKAQDMQIQRIQTVGTFMPHLVSSNEKETDVSLMAIEAMGDPALAKQLDDRLRTAREVSVATKFATSSSPEEAQQTMRSLLPIFDDIAAHAQEYDHIRGTMSSGPERTISMTRLVEATKAQARRANLSAEEIDVFFSQGDGGRIAALAAIQATPHAYCFPIAKEAVMNSKSAFEQYEALRAIAALVPHLNADERREVVEVIEDQRSGGPKKYITRDSDRWPLSERILSEISRSPGQP